MMRSLSVQSILLFLSVWKMDQILSFHRKSGLCILQNFNIKCWSAKLEIRKIVNSLNKWTRNFGPFFKQLVYTRYCIPGENLYTRGHHRWRPAYSGEGSLGNPRKEGHLLIFWWMNITKDILSDSDYKFPRGDKYHWYFLSLTSGFRLLTGSWCLVSDISTSLQIKKWIWKSVEKELFFTVISKSIICLPDNTWWRLDESTSDPGKSISG